MRPQLPLPLQVAEPAGLLLGHGTVTGCLAKWRDGVPDVVEQQRGQVPADALADQDPLHRDVGHRAGQRVGRHLPAADAQPVGQVVERVAGVFALADPPGDRRDAGGRVAVAQQLERPELDDLAGQVLAGVVAGVVELR